jgi:2,4-dienoyl-CoA reductase-like NADH-dependent reductase (Old Yellow Enzyme family)
MDIPQDLIELFSEFAAGGVRYLIVGGHAVAAHGRPRSTKDVDIWLDATADNIERTCTALARFGVPSEIVAALRDAGKEDIVWLGRPPLRIDLLQSLPALEFEQAWPRRLVVELAGVSVAVLGKEDLIANKLAVGRPQDRRDVRALLGKKRTPRRR